MALFDAMFEFSDYQLLTGSAQSTNILDMQAADLEMGAGTPIYLNVRVNAAADMAGGTTLIVRLHNSSTTDIDAGTEGSTNNILWSSGTLAQANLTAGTWITRIALPVNFDSNRYVGLQYTDAGAYTAGGIDAWLDQGPQSSYDTQVSASNI